MRMCCEVLFHKACGGKCSDYQGFLNIFFQNSVQISSMYFYIQAWMVTPLSAVGKHCDYMMNIEFIQVMYTELVWPFFSQLFPHVYFLQKLSIIDIVDHGCHRNLMQPRVQDAPGPQVSRHGTCGRFFDTPTHGSYKE